VRALLRHDGPVVALAFSPDGRRLASAEAGGPPKHPVKLWDPANGEEVFGFTLDTSARPLSALAFSPDGQLLAAAAGDTVQVWSAAAK
jgi:WD40 repeat protein